MKSTLLKGMVLVALLLTMGCEQTKVETEVFPERIPENPDAYVIARVDAVVLSEPSIDSKGLGTVKQGDQLTVLLEKTVEIPKEPGSSELQQVEFSKVTVRPTNTTGWIYSDLCLRIPPSPFWEGDTEKARDTAKKIYQDKLMLEKDKETGEPKYPISKVTVEAAYNKVSFQISNKGEEKVVFKKANAEELASAWIERVKEMFPEWKRPVIFINAFDGETDYTMTMSEPNQPNYL